MDNHFMHEFKRQASFFFKEKIKAARLALTDVTPAELLTEEATDGASWSAPETRSMRIISRAAFEVDDYWRIVNILHKRLPQYDNGRNWRASYKALILLEHLLTHGPARVAEEFQGDQDIIREMTNFHYVDEKGFNWGLSVQRKSERVLNLIEDGSFLKEERTRARNITSGIKGFGSFCKRPFLSDESSKDATCERYLTCNSQFNYYQGREDSGLALEKESIWKAQETRDEFISLASEKPGQIINSTRSLGNGHTIEEDHPFYEKENQAQVSLLSSVR